MDSLSLEIIYDISEKVYGYQEDTGERWKEVDRDAKRNVLSIRAVCRAFRDASWNQFAEILENTVFYLTKDKLEDLWQIANHPRLAQRITTLTFGGQLFDSNTLSTIKQLKESHPLHHTAPSSPGSWQSSLASETAHRYTDLQQLDNWYEGGLKSQDEFFQSGFATIELTESLRNLAPLSLRAVNFAAHPRAITCKPSNDGKLQFGFCKKEDPEVTPWANTVAYSTMASGWRQLGNALEAVSDGLVHTELPLTDLRATCLSNVRWDLSCYMFEPQLFKNLRILRISLNEPAMVRDEVYANPRLVDFADTFVECLLNATHLATLDLQLDNGGFENSYILAKLAHSNVPFRLENLTLEHTTQSAETLTRLMLPHISTLKRVLFLNTWIRPGKWIEWIRNMQAAKLKLDYLEFWKPGQLGTEYYRGDDPKFWFTKKDADKIATTSSLTCYESNVEIVREDGTTTTTFEEWMNAFPRYGSR